MEEGVGENPALYAPDLVGARTDGVRRPADQAGGDFHLGGDDELVGALNTRRASAQELRGSKSGHYSELEPGHSWRMMHESLIEMLR
jgi:hypothetical protein